MQLENVFTDTNEQVKALERLTTLKHLVGQLQYEYQLEFDRLLLSAGRDSQANLTKIRYLKNIFSNPTKLYTASIAKPNDYYIYSEEVEQIITNLKGTNQFKAAYKKQVREKGKDAILNIIVTTYSYSQPITTEVDTNSNIVIALIPTNRGCRRGPRGQFNHASTINSKQYAKQVNSTEREKYYEKRLCFYYGLARY